ncbi:MAG: hypothetical protein OXS30_07775 [Chloroflexota bacterium]|nr:hypothetical protein [Chloroflexota bacterium]
MLIDQDLAAILSDNTKTISQNIFWDKDEDHSGAQEFRVGVWSEADWPLQVYGWFNDQIGQLSYSLLHLRDGRIVGLDLGDRLIHHNPDCNRRRRRTTCACPRGTHKQVHSEQHQMRVAYVPADISASWDDPVSVWRQFCEEVRIEHLGTLAAPEWQGELEI